MKNLFVGSKPWQQGGFRERYAIEHSVRPEVWQDHRGHQMWTFSYGTEDEYQDANGATYDVTEERWVN